LIASTKSKKIKLPYVVTDNNHNRMNKIERISPVLLIIGGIIPTAIGIVWIILPFLLISRLDMIKTEINEINVAVMRHEARARNPANR
jgi:hypothetical protein